ncbi:calcium-binding and coiled-coil domain-containing protein 2-like [Ambystoma mexicanum]|uniref:calcium-binding and coiled-coil domain-containing protein 2-like n=1 Tax=Ambystoma mexicanum TaxID=8296 RepID=UPI0037E977D2
MVVMEEKYRESITFAQNQSELLKQTQSELKQVAEKLQESQNFEVELENIIKQLKEVLAVPQQNNSEQEAKLGTLKEECQEKVESLKESQLKLSQQVKYNSTCPEQINTLLNQIKKLEEKSNKLIIKELHSQTEFDHERQKLGAIKQQRDELTEQIGTLYQEKDALYQEVRTLKTEHQKRVRPSTTD